MHYVFVPNFRIDAGLADYYGYRWWIQVGSIVFFVSPITPTGGDDGA